ncbi:hypothetical protein [Acrocarpospora sp. B8E8]|uniref:hypothetical protein n=1 Tax=Acrocarpospora sp. B8E8 TaxID=3153572 RepID=UPI00325DBD7F
MSQFSYPYDAGDGASINEDQWSFLAASWQDNGVDCAGPWQNDLKVSSQAEDLTLSVAPGHAFIEGFHFHLTETTAVYFTANPTTSPRLDLVVLALDKTSNTISLEVKPGVPAAVPAPPALDSSRDTREIPLATVRVRANAATVLPSEVYEARHYRGRRVRITDTPETLSRGDLFYRPSGDVVGFVLADGSVRRLADEAALTASTASTLASAQTYTDTKSAATLASAKSYAESLSSVNTVATRVSPTRVDTAAGSNVPTLSGAFTLPNSYPAGASLLAFSITGNITFVSGSAYSSPITGYSGFAFYDGSTVMAEVSGVAVAYPSGNTFAGHVNGIGLAPLPAPGSTVNLGVRPYGLYPSSGGYSVPSLWAVENTRLAIGIL